MKWPMVKLGDICEPKQWPTLAKSNAQTGDVPVYGANGRIGWTKAPTHTRPTILVGCRGSCGTVHLLPAGGYANGNAMALDFLNESKVDIMYLKRFLEFRGFQDVITGSSQPQIIRSNIVRVKAPLPPLDEQKRIAAILDKADALRRKRRQAIALLEGLTQSIFLEIFGDPRENPKNFPLMTVESLSIKYSDGPFGSNLTSSDYTESGVRVIRLQNIGDGQFENEDAAFISEGHFTALHRHECLPGDVLIGTLGDPNLRACVQPEWLKRALNKADCVQLRPNTSIANAHYISALLNNSSVRRLASKLVLGQTRGRISMGRLRELKLPIGPLSRQARFSETCGKLEAEKSLLYLQASHLDALFSSLQHRAFNGEL